MLVAFASVATCSVADCERKHAEHKQLSSGSTTTTFTTLSVQSVLDESRLNFLRLQRHAQEVGQLQGVQRGSRSKRKAFDSSCVEDVGTTNAAALSLRTTTTNLASQDSKSASSLTKKSSALHVFRSHYIQGQKAMGVKRDWVSKDSWGEIREEFNKLTADEQEKWKQAAKSHNACGKSSSNSKWVAVRPEELGSDCLAVSSSSGAESVKLDSDTTIVHAGLCFHDPRSLKLQTGTAGEFVRHLKDRFAAISLASQVNPWPIGESNILAALISLRMRGVRLKDTLKQLGKTLQATAGPKSNSEQDTFPKKVQYNQHCQGVCCSLAFDLIKSQTRIVEVLNKVASSYKRPSDMIRDDLMFLFEIRISENQLVQEFYMVTAVAFRGGIQKAVQSYIKLQKAPGFDQTHVLELVPSAHVPSIRSKPWPSPIQRAYESDYGISGSIESLSTVQLAAHLVQVGANGQKMDITVQKCLYQDMSRSAMKFLGVAIDWQPIRVFSDEHREAVGQPSSSSVGSGNLGPAGADTASDGFDMLDDFLQDADANKTRQRRKATATADTPGGTGFEGNTAFLRDEMVSQLLEALAISDSHQAHEASEADVSDSPAKPKWRQHFEGLIDPEQLDVLREAEDLFVSQPAASKPAEPQLNYESICNYFVYIYIILYMSSENTMVSLKQVHKKKSSTQQHKIYY